MCSSWLSVFVIVHCDSIDLASCWRVSYLLIFDCPHCPQARCRASLLILMLFVQIDE